MSQVQISEGTMINGRYRVIRPLGKGGMGSVFLAEHTRLNTIHALKQVIFPSPDGAKSEAEHAEVIARSEGEARTLVSLEHPNLPRVTDAFVEENCFYLVMEFIEGKTLETQLRENGGRPLSVRTVVNVGLQISDVLAYLHSLDPPLIFRDLKPANVMVQPDGRVRLIDFGIARRFQPGASRDTALLGSVGYSPPEQFGRAQTDIRSDVYAFGATLHHLLTGRDPISQPFKFPPADTLNLLVPKELAVLISECVSMEPEARPKTMHAVAMRLLQIKDALPPDPISAADPAEPPPASEGASGVVSGSGGYNSAKLTSGALKTGTQETPESYGHFPQENNSPSKKGWIAAGSTVGILAAILGVYALSHPKAKSASTVPVLGSGNSSGSSPIAAPPASLPPQDGGSPPQTQPKADTPAAPNTALFEASFEKVGMAGVEQNARGAAFIHFVVSGQIKGQKGSSGVVTLFFYDGAGVPLPAVDNRPENSYRNPEGQLSVAYPLPIPDDPYHFELPLYLPLDQIPASALQAGVQFKAVLLINNAKAAASIFTPLPLPLPTPQIPPADKNNAPSMGGGTILNGK